MSKTNANETAFRGHMRRNATLEAQLVKHGADFDEPRRIDLHFRAASGEMAALLGRHLYGNGFVITCMAPSADKRPADWNVEAQTKRSIREVLSEEFTREMVVLASLNSSTYDGWGTSI